MPLVNDEKDGMREVSFNKKVLLRERKRHTARCIASTRFADQFPDRYSIQSWMGGGGGVPHPV